MKHGIATAGVGRAPLGSSQPISAIHSGTVPTSKATTPVGTVRSRIFRAREAIDKALQPLLQEN